MSGFGGDFDFTGAIFGPGGQFDDPNNPLFLGATQAEPATGEATNAAGDATMATPAGSPLDWASQDQLAGAGITSSRDWAGYADKLKKGLAGAQQAAKAQPQPSDAAAGWPLGRPRAGAAPQSQGTAPAGLANMIQLLQQRAQALRGQYLASGNLPPRGPGGGLLGM
jgi:hypothetical protein